MIFIFLKSVKELTQTENEKNKIRLNITEELIYFNNTTILR